jgi:E3 ubiquitin-protein ligase SHPRH
LQILATALKKNGIKHACCYNAKDLSSSKKSTAQAPLDKFKHDLNIRVLLIPLVLGADGLSIIEATHVFLLEPLVNPSTELQAIARVARIGQTRPTHVHKYILTKTIEERIHRAAQANAGQTESISGKSPMKKRVGDKNAVSIDLLEELYSNN